MNIRLFIIIFVVALCASSSAEAQSLAQELNVGTSGPLVDDIFTEEIKTISNSKKIFILTNENQKLRKGDFISIILDGELASRAIVAKITPDRVGIKMLRIYSLSQWQKLRLDLPVQILRGDDSYFKKSATKDEEVSDGSPAIQSEKDLFNDTGLELDEEEGKNRIIRPDNIAGISYSQLVVTDTNAREKRFNRITFSWAKQFKDNYWAEGVYSFINLPNFPSPEVVQSIAHEFMARIKYNIKAPAYTFVMPYVGMVKRFINAPAVENGGTDTEKSKITDLEEFQIAVGATVLRRLVPGWFLTANIGTDMLNFGVSVEF